MSTTRQGDLFDDDNNEEMERLAAARAESDDLALGRELGRQGGR